MITMTVKSATVFDDEIRERVLYFNLEKPEVVELLSENPKLLSTAEAMRNQAAVPMDVWEFITALVLKGYGKRVNGDEFLKNDDIRNAFKADKPYSQLLDDLMGENDATKAIEFVTNILPKGAIEAARAKVEEDEKAKTRPVPTKDHQSPQVSPRREARERAIREGEFSHDPEIGG